MNSKYLITSLHRSLCYLIYCLIQLIISIMLLIYVMMMNNQLGHFGQKQSLYKPPVMICEGLLAFTICTDLVLKILMEGRVLQINIQYFYTYQRNSSQQAPMYQTFVPFYQLSLYYDEIYGISLISMRYLSLTVRMVVLLKQSYFVKLMQQQRDILIFKRSKNQDLSILDISSEILNDSQFVETMKLVSE
ncbi:unnamed protein product [Paramecium sonneborni]|uniref:Transmembrane protein n=1 Tax=Paramecium sonneborni TaxID=65129 RepID=A0A8S1R3Z5_9CILI|nr:unnamed protein product [Paramecium sonneborni]